MRKIKRHSFNKVEYDIIWEELPPLFRKIKGKKIKYNICGLCDNPKSECPELKINPKQHIKQIFRTCLHEALHAQFFNKLSENEIKKADHDIGEFLWKIFKNKLK